MASLCQTAIKRPIAAADKGLCDMASAQFGMSCDMAIGGPEDVIGDIMCGQGMDMTEAACKSGGDARRGEPEHRSEE